MTNVSTNVVKLDLKVILDNYKNPKFWQKDWTIVKTKEIEIIWHLCSIDCKGNKIRSEVKVLNKHIKRGKNDYSNVWCISETADLPSIPVNNKEYTQQHFENALYGSIMSLLEDVERHITYEYKEYKEAEQAQEDFKDKLREIANEFLDQENVTNDVIREAYIDKYVSTRYDKDDVAHYTRDIITNYKHKIIPNAYIYTAAWFNKEEEYNKFSEMYYKDHKKKSIMIDIWHKCREIQTVKWQSSMKELLAGI